MYQLIIRPKAEKHFSKLPQKLQTRIVGSLKKLATDPFQAGFDIKKLAGTGRSYRLRAGELRVIYEMNTSRKEIFITDIDFRRTTTY